MIGGRFRLEGAARRGGIGAVYRARDEQTGKDVAVKLVALGSEDAVHRFAREAEVLASLDHPGIVRHVASGREPDGTQYLAMEWLEGESLAERLVRAGPLDTKGAIALARAIADALAFAHGRGLVHRDIKPGNIFLVGKDPAAPRLIDFGVARVQDAQSELTTVGLALGTVGYMAPEQARGEKSVDARADVFSMGCVLFRALTGQPPFAGSNLTAVLAKTLFEDAPRLGELRPDVPASLDVLVARMLAKEPPLRPADGAALAMELAELGDATRASTMPPAYALTTGEQHLVCVVLADPGGRLEVTLLEELRACAVRFGAHLDRLANGQLLVTLFGTRNATDQAAQAARCALAMQELLPRAPLVLATGRGVVSGRIPVGQAIDRAVARLESSTTGRRGRGGVDLTPVPPQARDALIALDDVTAGLLDTRFAVVAREDGLYLKAERDPLDASRTLLGRPAPFVGRARELGILKAVLDASIDESQAHAVLVTGAAGVGKSRLRYEFLREVGKRGVEVWIGRADPMSRGSPLRMIAQALRHAMGIVDGEPLGGSRQKVRNRVLRNLRAGEAATRVAEFLGELLSVPFPEDESVQLRAARQDPVLRGDQMRRALEDFTAAECKAQPLVLVLEDLHWGDQPTVDVVEQLLRNLHDKPLLVVAVARPEVDEIFAPLWQKAEVTRLPLGELGGRAAASLVKEMLGDAVTDAQVEDLTRRAEGNAFFLEELIRAVASHEEQALPETVLAMVQTRLERLPSEERRALRAASVFGAVCWYGGIAELVGGESKKTLGPTLDSLVARELLSRRQASRFKGQAEYVFRHDHVREAAYASLMDRDRPLGHRLAGGWLEDVGETDALVLAEHYERGRDGERAVRWFKRAAEQALAANDLAAALARAERALSGASSQEDIGALRLLQAEVHAWRGEHGDVRARGEEAMRALAHGASEWYEAAGQVAEACGRLGDDDGLESIGRVLAALARAGGAGSAPEAVACTRAATQLMWAGRFELASDLVGAVEPWRARLAEGDPGAAAWIDYARSVRALFAGDIGENLVLKQATVAGFERAGDERTACIMRVRAGYASLLLGAHEEGERVLRGALSASLRMGLSKVSALAKHNLGLALARTGHTDEARAVELDALADFEAQGDRRLAGASQLYLAWIAATAGDLPAAETHARAAVEMQQNKPPSYAEARATLAWVLLEAGRAPEALAEAKAAHELLESLGAVEDAEALIRWVHAAALDASGDREAARAAIARARERLVERAARITDAALRRSFLEDEPDHRRTMQLAGTLNPIGD
jgi:tetratricopeptide (TPR) repeat protein